MPVHCRNQVAAACRRTPIRAPIREPRHTTWPYLHVCTRGGRAPPWNFRYTGLPFLCVHSCTITHTCRLLWGTTSRRRSSLSLSSGCSCTGCSGTCPFSHTGRGVHVNVTSARAPKGRESFRTGFVLAHLGVKGTRFLRTREICFGLGNSPVVLCSRLRRAADHDEEEFVCGGFSSRLRLLGDC